MLAKWPYYRLNCRRGSRRAVRPFISRIFNDSDWPSDRYAGEAYLT